MRAAEKQEMTNGEYAFIYLDLYNTNTSYFWTDEDDHIGNSTSADNSDYSSNDFFQCLLTSAFFKAFQGPPKWVPRQIKLWGPIGLFWISILYAKIVRTSNIY